MESNTNNRLKGTKRMTKMEKIVGMKYLLGEWPAKKMARIVKKSRRQILDMMALLKTTSKVKTTM